MTRPRLTKEEPMQGLPLHLAYRPTKLHHVVGHDRIVKSLEAVLDKKKPPHSYLFTGPSGVGKTTLARIVVDTLGVSSDSVIEVDSASYSQIDTIRNLVQTVAYPTLGDNPNRAVILDECQALSKQAWQVLLKPIEEPPSFTYWLFCTTEPDKVPQNIKTRCHAYSLGPLSEEVLYEYLAIISDQEKYSISEDALTIVAENSNGSPRQALQNLSACRDCQTRKEALALIDKGIVGSTVIELARLLCNPNKATWRYLHPILNSLASEDAEGVRLVVVSYLTKVLQGANDEKRAAYLLNVLANFESPFPSNMKSAPLYLACGRCVFGG